jgi:Mn-dependent DtxR family transcriptional regulator
LHGVGAINNRPYVVGRYVNVKIYESAENYLETILVLTKRNGNVRSIDIANKLDFTKPSISIAMKNLRENGYITMDGEGQIKLTDKGYEVATNVYERHTFITDWFISLGVDRQTAVDDACRIEHILSAETYDAIKRHVMNSKENRWGD